MRLLFHVLTTTRTWLQVALASLDFRPFWERHRAMGPDEWLEKIRPSSQQSAGKSSILAGKFRWPISHYAFQNRSRLLRSSTIDDAKYPHLSLAIEKLRRRTKLQSYLELQHFQKSIEVSWTQWISRWVAHSCWKFVTYNCLSTENSQVPTNWFEFRRYCPKGAAAVAK